MVLASATPALLYAETCAACTVEFLSTGQKQGRVCTNSVNKCSAAIDSAGKSCTPDCEGGYSLCSFRAASMLLLLPLVSKRAAVGGTGSTCACSKGQLRSLLEALRVVCHVNHHGVGYTGAFDYSERDDCHQPASLKCPA